MASTADRIRKLIEDNLEVDGQPIALPDDLKSALPRLAFPPWTSLRSQSLSPRNSTWSSLLRIVLTSRRCRNSAAVWTLLPEHSIRPKVARSEGCAFRRLRGIQARL